MVPICTVVGVNIKADERIEKFFLASCDSSDFKVTGRFEGYSARHAAGTGIATAERAVGKEST
jgi:hypothetical protein